MYIPKDHDECVSIIGPENFIKYEVERALAVQELKEACEEAFALNKDKDINAAIINVYFTAAKLLKNYPILPA